MSIRYRQHSRPEICTLFVTAAKLTIWYLRTEAISDAFRNPGKLAVVFSEQINRPIPAKE